MEEFMVDLKTFLGLAIPNQACLDIKIFGVIGVIFGARNPQPS